jgi:hypothetical protein
MSVDEGEHLPVAGREVAENGHDGAARRVGTALSRIGPQVKASVRDRQGLAARDGKQPGPHQVPCPRQVLASGQRRPRGIRRDSLAAGQRTAVIEQLGGVRGEQPGEGSIGLLGHRTSW